MKPCNADRGEDIENRSLGPLVGLALGAPGRHPLNKKRRIQTPPWERDCPTAPCTASSVVSPSTSSQHNTAGCQGSRRTIMCQHNDTACLILRQWIEGWSGYAVHSRSEKCTKGGKGAIIRIAQKRRFEQLCGLHLSGDGENISRMLPRDSRPGVFSQCLRCLPTRRSDFSINALECWRRETFVR